MTMSKLPPREGVSGHRAWSRAAQRIAATVAIVSLTTLSCATSGVNSGDFNLISLDEEWQLGAQLERDLRKQLKLVRSGSAVADLGRIGSAIVGQTELRDRPWTFHLVDDPAINAFNIPGGHVYVNTGLVAAAPDAAAFAGVLGHEIAHGVARHGTEQLTKAYGINVLAGVLLGQNPAMYEQILAQILAGGAVARFSRQAEREADELGVRFSYESGYDPMGLARMLEVIAEQSQRNPGRVERFFATHPLTQERIDETRQMASSLEGGRRDDPSFADLQRVAARAN